MAPLLALQELDARIRELQQEIRDVPARKEQEESRMREAQERLAAAQSELRAVQTRVADFELQVQTVRDRITKLKQQQLTLKTNKEFRAMDMEIATATREIDGIESQQIAAMDALVPAKARVAAADGRFNEEKAQVDGYVQELKGRVSEAAAALRGLEAERTELAAKVAPQHLRVYDRLRASRWPPVVKLEEGVCGGCHLTQPPSIGHLVRRNNVLVACQMCGRLLYG